MTSPPIKRSKRHFYEYKSDSSSDSESQFDAFKHVTKWRLQFQPSYRPSLVTPIYRVNRDSVHKLSQDHLLAIYADILEKRGEMNKENKKQRFLDLMEAACLYALKSFQTFDTEQLEHALDIIRKLLDETDKDHPTFIGTEWLASHGKYILHMMVAVVSQQRFKNRERFPIDCDRLSQYKAHNIQYEELTDCVLGNRYDELAKLQFEKAQKIGCEHGGVKNLRLSLEKFFGMFELHRDPTILYCHILLAIRKTRR
ncbi:hypothetical protein ACOME3_002401 [Neoechinorhynchus agilis]